MFNGSNLPDQLLLTIWQTNKLRKAIQNNMSADIKLPKTQISKIIQSGEFLGKLAGPLMKVGVPLAKQILVLLGFTAAFSAIDAKIQTKW